jgi:tRNA pseudouridine55 synthase
MSNLENPTSGLLVLDKPQDMTSRRVVDAVVRLVGRSVRVGHAGTLDPLATGVLVVALGAATRLIEHVQRMTKQYRALIRLGVTSETDDADGPVVECPVDPIPTEAEVRAALAGQVGTIAQVPPRFAALKVDGRRAYDLARRGDAPDLRPRPVRIDAIEVIRYAWPELEIDVTCGAGTYIRAIARDVGERLGCGGLIAALRRTRIGPFGVEQALDPRHLTAEVLASHLRPALEAVSDLPRLRLDAEQAALVRNGRALDARRVAGAVACPRGWVALVDAEGRLVALGEADPVSGRVAPRRVLA